jgi:hypothetical protein
MISAHLSEAIERRRFIGERGEQGMGVRLEPAHHDRVLPQFMTASDVQGNQLLQSRAVAEHSLHQFYNPHKNLQ